MKSLGVGRLQPSRLWTLLPLGSPSSAPTSRQPEPLELCAFHCSFISEIPSPSLQKGKLRLRGPGTSNLGLHTKEPGIKWGSSVLGPTEKGRARGP